LALDFGEDGLVRIDGRSREAEIRGARVTGQVSIVSAHKLVRAAIVARQRELASRPPGVVAEGRDTTTVVFPFARPKFFLWATPRTRAQRRAAELGEPERVQEIEAKLAARDERDSTRAVGPLRQADDAIRLDTDGMSLEEVVEELLQHARAALEADEA
jgi:cytidylate kinase